MGKRKRHTNGEKLAIARQTLLPWLQDCLCTIAHGRGLPESTVQGWLKNFENPAATDLSTCYTKEMYRDVRVYTTRTSVLPVGHSTKLRRFQ